MVINHGVVFLYRTFKYNVFPREKSFYTVAYEKGSIQSDIINNDNENAINDVGYSRIIKSIFQVKVFDCLFLNAIIF